MVGGSFSLTRLYLFSFFLWLKKNGFFLGTESITETFYWVQGKYLNNEWRYDDGSLITYFRWAPNHPFKNDLIAFNSGNGFHGTTDTYQDVFFCEIRL